MRLVIARAHYRRTRFAMGTFVKARRAPRSPGDVIEQRTVSVPSTTKPTLCSPPRLRRGATFERPGQWTFVPLCDNAAKDTAQGDTVPVRSSETRRNLDRVARSDLLASAVIGRRWRGAVERCWRWRGLGIGIASRRGF